MKIGKGYRKREVKGVGFQEVEGKGGMSKGTRGKIWRRGETEGARKHQDKEGEGR